MKTKLLLLFVLCAAIVSCTKDGGADKKDGTPYGAVKHLDIVGAQYLYTTGVIPTRAATRGDDGENPGTGEERIFKILFDGTTHQVVVKDENGTEVAMHRVILRNVTDNLILFAFSYPYGEGDYPDMKTSAYFVRKNDGAVFELPEMFYYAFDVYGRGRNSTRASLDGKNDDRVRTDKYQNIYANGDDGLYKIAQIGDGIVATKLPGYGPIDWAGNMLYRNSFGNLECMTEKGETFKIQGTTYYNIEHYFALKNRASGGFLSKGDRFNHDNYCEGYFIVEIDAEAKTLKETFLDGLKPQTDSFLALLDKIIFTNFGQPPMSRSGDGYDEHRETITILHNNDLSINVLTLPASVGRRTQIPLADLNSKHIYWADQGGIYDFDIEAEEIKTLYTLQQGVEYSNFIFADDLIMFRKTDYVNEKRDKCELRSGVYSETEITSEGDGPNEAPKIINFVKVN